MHFTLAPKQQLMGLLVGCVDKRRGFLGQLGQGAGKLDLVFAVFGMNGKREQGFSGFRPFGGGVVAGFRQRNAGGDLFHPPQGGDLAGDGLGQLFVFLAQGAV